MRTYTHEETRPIFYFGVFIGFLIGLAAGWLFL